MRIRPALLLVSFSLISLTAWANKLQIDRRQFLVGTGAALSTPFLPKSAMALAKFESSSPLTARIQALIADSTFTQSLSPFHMTGVIGSFNFKAALDYHRKFFAKNRPAMEAVVKEAYKSEDLRTWRVDVDWVEQASFVSASKKWGELSAIEMAEGEMEVARLLKLPLQTVQNEVDALRNISRYIPTVVARRRSGFDELMIKHESLGENFLRVYLQVMERRIPRFKEVIGMSLDFYTRYHGAPGWALEYNTQFRAIYTDMLRAQRAGPVVREEGSWLGQLSSVPARLRQTCADMMNSLIHEKVEVREENRISHEALAPAKPAPELTLPEPSPTLSNY